MEKLTMLEKILKDVLEAISSMNKTEAVLDEVIELMDKGELTPVERRGLALKIIVESCDGDPAEAAKELEIMKESCLEFEKESEEK